jgi:DNA replication protein DnaC
MPGETPEARRLRFAAEAAAERKVRRADCWRALVAGRGERYRDCRLNNFEVTTEAQGSVRAVLVEFCQDINQNVGKGRGLILYGPKGTGKDHLAMACARAAVAACHSLAWVNGMDLFGTFRDAMGSGDRESELIARYTGADVLWISDPLPPAGALTEFQSQTLFRILDRRYSQRRGTWITVNVAKAVELEQRVGAQNFDRLRDGALVLSCNWPSYRRAVT